MSIVRPLEGLGGSSNEAMLYRNGRVAAAAAAPTTPGLLNPMMKLQFRPEVNGVNGVIPMNPPPLYSDTIMQAQSMDLLTKRPLSDIERQCIYRAVKQRTHSNASPIFSSSSPDSVLLSNSPDIPSSYLFSQRHHQFMTPSPYYARLPMTSDGLGMDRLLGLPLQGIKAPSFNNLPSLKVPRGVVVNAKVPAQDVGLRNRLEELERELLSDNNDDNNVLGSPEQSNGLDHEWVQNLLSEENQNQSTLLQSNVSGGSLNNNISSSQASRSYPKNNNTSQSLSSQQEQKSSVTQSQGEAVTSSRKLLVDCANAISESNVDNAVSILQGLIHTISVYGDPMQRLTAYMVESLVVRLGSAAKGLHNDLMKSLETPTKDNLSMAKLIYEACPYIKFSCLTAINIIHEAVKDEPKVHIIDFEIKQENQYASLIHQLAERKGGPPELRISVIEDPDSLCHSGEIRDKLIKLAHAVGVPLKFHPVHEKASELQPWMLDCKPGEAIAVNFALFLHRMPDESVSTKNPRDHLLRLVKALKPKVVTLIEKDMNTNTAPFLPRFMEALNFYSAAFHSLDVAVPRESKDRINLEKNCLARDMVNIIACEGAERVERHEVAGKWRARMTMAGFSPTPLDTSKDVDKSIISQFEGCDSRYTLKDDKGALHFGFSDKVLVVVSAWH